MHLSKVLVPCSPAFCTRVLGIANCADDRSTRRASQGPGWRGEGESLACGAASIGTWSVDVTALRKDMSEVVHAALYCIL